MVFGICAIIEAGLLGINLIARLVKGVAREVPPLTAEISNGNRQRLHEVHQDHKFDTRAKARIFCRLDDPSR